MRNLFILSFSFEVFILIVARSVRKKKRNIRSRGERRDGNLCDKTKNKSIFYCCDNDGLIISNWLQESLISSQS